MPRIPPTNGVKFKKGQSGNPKGRPPDALNASLKKLTKEELEVLTLSDNKIKAKIDGHNVKKIIVVLDKLVNVVIDL